MVMVVAPNASHLYRLIFVDTGALGRSSRYISYHRNDFTIDRIMMHLETFSTIWSFLNKAVILVLQNAALVAHDRILHSVTVPGYCIKLTYLLKAH